MASKKEPACRVISCGTESSQEIDAWNCVGKHIFKPTRNPGTKSFVEHDCGGVGFGNSVRALSHSVALAMILNRRLIVKFDAMNRMWMPPFGSDSWDYNVNAILQGGGSDHSHHLSRRHTATEIWDYEAHARPPKRVGDWIKSLSANVSQSGYQKMILQGGVCGSVRDILTEGNCVSKAFPNYGRCLTSTDYGALSYSEQLMQVPFFYTTFSRPGPMMVEALRTIRTRLSLPQLELGLEPSPGVWGIHTPGYYIFALHVRHIPLGFEPLSVETNTQERKKKQRDAMVGFWHQAKENAAKARKIAKCRKEKFLIYFATDNVNVRSEAKKRLSSIGRVVFGLQENEVGHSIPQWTDRSIEEVGDAIRKEVEVDVSDSGSLESEEDGSMSYIKGDIVQVNKTEEATELHANMAMVEWWILATSQWLVILFGTSYSDTAASWGLGPGGFMERHDVIYQRDSVQTSRRRDWYGDACSLVYSSSADPRHSTHCPNE